MAINNKKHPKYFLKLFTFTFIDIFAPIIAPTIPNIIILIEIFKSIFLFFKLIIVAVIAVGIKKIKLLACAICCSKLQNDVSKNISIAPPPHSYTTYNS